MPKILTDLPKLILLSEKGAFKNNKIYEGAVTFGGTATPGTNFRTFVIPLEKVPDLLSGVFNGPTDTVFASDPRPGSAWFKRGYVWALGNDAGAGYTNYPTAWEVQLSINGANAIIKLTNIQQFTANLAITNTNLSYRILDYSVF